MDSFNLAKSIFFGLGERIAFIFVIIVFTLLFFIETTNPAFSKQEKDYAGYTKKGLTYDYYLSSSYSFAVDADQNSAFTNHTEQSTLNHNIFIDSQSGEVWDKIAQCESKGNWGINTGNGYYGGLQFSEGAWRSVGGMGMPHEASREEQISKGKLLQERRGWGVWGLCAKRLGLN